MKVYLILDFKLGSNFLDKIINVVTGKVLKLSSISCFKLNNFTVFSFKYRSR